MRRTGEECGGVGMNKEEWGGIGRNGEEWGGMGRNGEESGMGRSRRDTVVAS